MQIWTETCDEPAPVCRATSHQDARDKIDALYGEAEAFEWTDGSRFRDTSGQIKFFYTDLKGYKYNRIGQRKAKRSVSLEVIENWGDVQLATQDDTSLISRVDDEEDLVRFRKALRECCDSGYIAILRSIYTGGDYDEEVELEEPPVENLIEEK